MEMWHRRRVHNLGVFQLAAGEVPKLDLLSLLYNFVDTIKEPLLVVLVAEIN